MKSNLSLLDLLPSPYAFDDVIEDAPPSPLSAAHLGVSQPKQPSPKTKESDMAVCIESAAAISPNYMPTPKLWSLTQAEKEEIAQSISQTWTDQAIRCYMSAANCQNCDIPNGCYSFVCQMNKVVPVLLGSLGEPDVKRVKRIYPQGYAPQSI